MASHLTEMLEEANDEIKRLRGLLRVELAECAECDSLQQTFFDGEARICLNRDECAKRKAQNTYAHYERRIGELVAELNGDTGGIHDELNEDREPSGMWRVEIGVRRDWLAKPTSYFDVEGTGHAVVHALELLKAGLDSYVAKAEQAKRDHYRELAENHP